VTHRDLDRNRRNTKAVRSGGQPGHEGKSRDLYPIEKCSDVIEYHPTICLGCGESLREKMKTHYAIK